MHPPFFLLTNNQQKALTSTATSPELEQYARWGWMIRESISFEENAHTTEASEYNQHPNFKTQKKPSVYTLCKKTISTMHKWESIRNLVHQSCKKNDNIQQSVYLFTHILLQRSAPNCYGCSYEPSRIHAHISNCAYSNSNKNHHYAELCCPRITNLIKHNLKKTWYWDHTQLRNLSWHYKSLSLREIIFHT